jgi:hypothetical protein
MDLYSRSEFASSSVGPVELDPQAAWADKNWQFPTILIKYKKDILVLPKRGSRKNLGRTAERNQSLNGVFHGKR